LRRDEKSPGGSLRGFSLFGNNSWLSNRRRSDGTQGHSPPVRAPGPAADLSGSRWASGWQKAAWAQPAQPCPHPPFPARRFRTIRRMIAATIRSRTPATRIYPKFWARYSSMDHASSLCWIVGQKIEKKRREQRDGPAGERRWFRPSRTVRLALPNP